MPRAPKSNPEQASGDAPRYSAPALEKGLDVLEALSAMAVPPTQAQLAARLERSASELFRMLACLEARGYVVKDTASGTYHLTLKLFQLAHTHSPAEALIRAAAEPMRQLARQLTQSCHLSVLERGQLVAIHQAESPDKIRLSVEVGASFEPLETASGRLLIAFLPAADRQQWLEHLGRNARQQLGAQLDEIRAKGHEVSNSQQLQGVRDCSVPVGTPAGNALAALTVPILSNANTSRQEPKLVAALKDAAATINKDLGVKL